MIAIVPAGPDTAHLHKRPNTDIMPALYDFISEYLNTPMQPNNNNRRYLRPTLYAALVLLMCLALVALNDYRQQSRNREAAANLSDILASQLASSASQAMLTGDRLSLQALVTALAGHHAVTAAAIYDASDKPLAMSGAHQVNEAYSIEAIITVDDSVAGYARVSLAEPLRRQGWQDPLVILLALLCSGLCFLGVNRRPPSLLAGGIGANVVDPEFTIDVSDPLAEAEPETPTQPQPAEQATHDDTASTDEIAAPAADHVGAQDLGAQVVFELNQTLEHPMSAILADAIQQVCQLYNGKAKPQGKGVVVDFSDGDDFNFRAFCASRLWQQLLEKINQQYPSLGAHISIRQNTEQEETHPSQESGNIYLTRLVLAHGELTNRISIVEEEDDWYRVKSVSEEIDQLLEKQLGHLINSLQDKYGHDEQQPPVH